MMAAFTVTDSIVLVRYDAYQYFGQTTVLSVSNYFYDVFAYIRKNTFMLLMDLVFFDMYIEEN